MARRVPALVKPELLVWARESAGISSLDQVAGLIGVDTLTLSEWESGHDLPSIADLRKLGEVYKRPIAVFFLAEPPRKFDAQREFRRLAGIVSRPPSAGLLLALRWAVFRREAAMELYRLAGESPPELHAQWFSSTKIFSGSPPSSLERTRVWSTPIGIARKQTLLSSRRPST